MQDVHIIGLDIAKTHFTHMLLRSTELHFLAKLFRGVGY